MSRPLLPLAETPLTPREAAECLRGIAEMLESYPAAGILLTLDVAVAQADDRSARTRRTAKAAQKTT